SVSKTLTAITLIKLLEEKKIPVDSSIVPYLPKDMTLHPSISNITFRQLLTHTSGLHDLGEPSYAVLKKELSKEVPASDKVYQYQNSNFGIMRVLIPTIEDGYAPPAATQDYTKSYLYGIRLMQATQKRVLNAVGIRSADCKNPSPDKCLSYQYPEPIQAGTDWGDMTATNAYRGWTLSAEEMSRVIRGLLYTEKLLTQAQREAMLSGRLGIFPANVAGLEEYGHNGMHPGNPVPGGLNLGEVGTTIAGYSNGISVALFVNSQIDSGDSTSKPIRTAIIADIAAHQ
ncbi:MAG: class A beta-lactamase-related serine hydrolase, partial [Alphaproteobacteria bacterium]